MVWCTTNCQDWKTIHLLMLFYNKIITQLPESQIHTRGWPHIHMYGTLYNLVFYTAAIFAIFPLNLIIFDLRSAEQTCHKVMIVWFCQWHNKWQTKSITEAGNRSFVVPFGRATTASDCLLNPIMPCDIPRQPQRFCRQATEQFRLWLVVVPGIPRPRAAMVVRCGGKR